MGDGRNTKLLYYSLLILLFHSMPHDLGLQWANKSESKGNNFAEAGLLIREIGLLYL